MGRLLAARCSGSFNLTVRRYQPVCGDAEMKTRALVPLALLAFVDWAAAQATATIYGVVDLNYQHVTAGDRVAPGVSGESINRLDGNQYTLTANRLGLRFMEDLGKGLRAGGVVETGFFPDTGQTANATLFWNRQSYVSLASTSWGEVRLGRQYRFQDETVRLNNPFGNGMILGLNYGYRTTGPFSDPGGFIPMFVDNARVSNAVQYMSPVFRGFRAQAIVAAGEVAAPRYEGLRFSYAKEPLTIAVAFETQGPGSTSRAKLWTVGGGYDFGILKLVGGYQRGRDLNAAMVGSPTDPAALSDNIGSYQDTTSRTLGLRKDIGAFAVGANYAQTRFRNSAGESRSLGRVAVGVTYGLSKQTRLFAAYGQATGDLRERIVESRLFQSGIDKSF